MFCVRPIFTGLRFRQMQSRIVVPLQRVVNINLFDTRRNFSLAAEEDESGKHVFILNLLLNQPTNVHEHA